MSIERRLRTIERIAAEMSKKLGASLPLAKCGHPWRFHHKTETQIPWQALFCKKSVSNVLLLANSESGACVCPRSSVLPLHFPFSTLYFLISPLEKQFSSLLSTSSSQLALLRVHFTDIEIKVRCDSFRPVSMESILWTFKAHSQIVALS